jgi:hypothetical protein
MGFRPATEYALRRCQEELERYQMEQVLSRCWTTGRLVFGTVDDDGELTIQEFRDDSG